MLDSTITLVKSDNSTTVDFKEVAYYNPNLGTGKQSNRKDKKTVERIRVSGSTTSPDRDSLRIAHEDRKISNHQGHNVVVSRETAVDDASGVMHSCITSFSITHDPDAVITKTMIYDQIRQIIDLVSTTGTVVIDTAKVDSLLLGEA